MTPHEITRLIPRCEGKTADLALGPLGRKSKGLDLFGSLLQRDPSSVEVDIQDRSQNAPELTFQSDDLLAWILYVSQLIEKLLRITGPSLIEER
jgi:hypothetical protein